MKRIATLLFFFCISAAAFCSGTLEFSSPVHDFGQVLLSGGAVSCSFSAKNTASTDVVIQSVSTSCGCTNVKWDHNAIAPGATTKIAVTYTNDEGPYPFDKVITVKLAGQSKPILLHIRGISVKAVKPDREVYTEVFGSAIGFTASSFKTGNMEQGGSRGDQTTIANLSSKPVKVTFAGVSDGLSLEVSPNPVPAGAHATLYYTVSSRPDIWGYNDYLATPVLNGVSSGKTLSVRSFTAENFSSLTKEQKASGSRPIFAESTFSFGHVKKGSVVNARFSCQNKGGAAFKVHKIDADNAGVVAGTFADIPAGRSGGFSLTFDTSSMPRGEALVIVTLTTNSPLRPIVNLFLAGWID